jgi:hypothetical protein
MMHVLDRDRKLVVDLLSKLHIVAPDSLTFCKLTFKSYAIEAYFAYTDYDGATRMRTVISPFSVDKFSKIFCEFFGVPFKEIAEITLYFEQDSISDISFTKELTTANIAELVNTLKA